MTKKGIAWLAALAAVACGGAAADPGKVYVAAQEVGRIDVLDADTLELLTSIAAGDGRAPHNVDLSADGARVLVTNAAVDGAAPDELLVIDPALDAIEARIELPAGAFVAHVVGDPAGGGAWVTGWGASHVYGVDLGARAMVADVELEAGASPHGMRPSADGARLYTANSKGSVSEIDARAGAVVRTFPLPGPAVQVAVGDGVVYATIFDPPAVARIDLRGGEPAIFRLPEGSRAPAQVVWSRDGTRLYVAEQGQASEPGNRIFELDLLGRVVAEHETGLGAHGLALSPDGDVLYVTGSFDGSLAALPVAGGGAPRLGRTGRGPNGVAVWRLGDRRR